MPGPPSDASAGALFLTGSPGSGKSTTLGALSTLLEIDGIAHGAIESEQLAWGWPWLSVEQAAQQLAAVLEFQRGAGRRLFLVAAGFYDARELRLLVGAVGAERSLVVALAAPAETVAARLAAREPDSWPGKADLISRARVLADVAPAVEGVDLVVDSSSARPEHVAEQVRDAMAARGMLSAGG